MLDRVHREARPRRNRNAAVVHRMHVLVDPRDMQRAVQPVKMEGLKNRHQQEQGKEPDRIAFNCYHRGPPIGISHPNNGIIEGPDRDTGQECVGDIVPILIVP